MLAMAPRSKGRGGRPTKEFLRKQKTIFSQETGGPLHLPPPIIDHRESFMTICGYCKRTKNEHEPGCKWNEAYECMIAPSRIPRRAASITEYRCERDHEFMSNLVLEEAKCPLCFSKAKETIT